ncbi:MAG: flavin reductase [Oscillospiraceae bacterium]
METNAIFKLTYGVFFLSTEQNEKINACVVNTVAQVTQTPLKISVTVLKSNLTHNMIKSSNKFFVGIMGENVSLDLIDNFGSQSGKSADKFSGMQIKKDVLGNPIIEDGCIATLTCEVTQTLDLTTHTMFIAQVVDAKNISNENPLTYAKYREKKSAKSAEKGGEKMAEKATYECTVCHYVYDGDIPFEDLPDDYVCPVCGEPKSAFEKV